jgi:polyhydroxyalkanoate depolymerase
MLYQAYQAQADLTEPWRLLAKSAYEFLDASSAMRDVPFAMAMRAALEMTSRAALTHDRPPYGIETIEVGNEIVPVREEVVTSTAFGALLRFRKDIAVKQPKVLVIAPMSGHFATLLRHTVRTLLSDNDVYITDWLNARDAPLSAGRFGFDEYVEHVMSFLETIGPGAHMVAVCQPCVQTLIAAALMNEDHHPAAPASMTLMAGPIDTRVSPTEVNKLANDKPIEWFERNLISTVPGKFKGAGRRVYPGFIQLTAFMAMNLDRHVKAHSDMFHELAAGEFDKAKVRKDFYDEYFAVLDLPAEFYLETVAQVFQQHLLPKGEMTWRGRKVDPGAIKRTALLTVEGERDDICSVGQTVAAQDLCANLRPYRKKHHLQAGVGHYGVFSGRRWETQIYPLVRNFILQND